MTELKDTDMVTIQISGRTYKRLRAIAKNDNQVTIVEMNNDTLINTALDWQKKMYDRIKHELNQFQRKIIKGE